MCRESDPPPAENLAEPDSIFIEQSIIENKIGIIIIFLLTNKTMYAIVISVTVINTESTKTINKEKDYEEICLQRLRLCT